MSWEGQTSSTNRAVQSNGGGGDRQALLFKPTWLLTINNAVWISFYGLCMGMSGKKNLKVRFEIK